MGTYSIDALSPSISFLHFAAPYHEQHVQDNSESWRASKLNNDSSENTELRRNITTHIATTARVTIGSRMRYVVALFTADSKVDMIARVPSGSRRTQTDRDLRGLVRALLWMAENSFATVCMPGCVIVVCEEDVGKGRQVRG